ncbi:MAG: type II toxin-antitoxin system RelE/ParE family toxin [Rhizobiales bacterium]|nr:type II toxin-antitoxin system RelE/ParE family toxin [Hyphomicrobiales bacterium]
MIYKKTPKADEDILGIYAYTLEQFGEEQAITYFRSLEGCFEFLCDHPRAAKQREEFNPPVRIHHHKKHFILYSVEDEYLLIVRVLHERRELKRYLDLLSGDNE